MKTFFFIFIIFFIWFAIYVLYVLWHDDEARSLVITVAIMSVVVISIHIFVYGLFYLFKC